MDPRRAGDLAGNPVAWSLSSEFAFYLAFPLLLAVVSRLSRQGIALVLVASAATSISLPLVLHPTATEGLRFWLVYVNPGYRVLEFVIGMALAHLLAQHMAWPIRLGPACLLAGCAYLVAGQVPAYAGYVAITLVPYSLLIAAAASCDLRGGTPGVLRSRPMLALGRWSYGFYLVHLLVIAAVGKMSVFGGASVVVEVLELLIALVASVALAGLVFRGVESPMQRCLRSAEAR